MNRNGGLKARSIGLSLPNKPLIEFHSVFLQERSVFILERACLEVLLLVRDVSSQCLQIRGADGKYPVTALLRKVGKFRGLFLEPFRRGSFQILHKLCHGQGAGKSYREVDVISGSTNPVAFAV